MSEHKTPWTVRSTRARDDYLIWDADHNVVCFVGTKATAALIVKSVNSHAALVAACGDVLRHITFGSDTWLRDELRAALALTKGGKT